MSSEVDTLPTPTARQLRIVGLRSAIPMVGFGFMDNIVMIQAGEAIDMSLGVAFGLSTLTAAGFGQCISDVAGFTCSGVVDAWFSKLNLPKHRLTAEQLGGKSARLYATFGGCVGVLTGCLLGMTCLLFMDTDRAERAKKAKELKSIFESILDEGHTLVNAERATLWMVDGDQLWSWVTIGMKRELRIAKESLGKIDSSLVAAGAGSLVAAGAGSFKFSQGGYGLQGVRSEVKLPKGALILR